MTLSPNQKGAIAVGTVFLVIGLGYLGYRFYVNRPFKKVDNQNFLDLQNNLGLKANSEDIVSTKFNEGENIVEFYNNNRFFVFDKDKKVIVAKGTYSNGGKKMVLDGGFTVESGSVFGNLLDILKKK